MIEDFRRYLDGRMAAMRSIRAPWFQHWGELADFILPKRYRWLVAANQPHRGSSVNRNIIDSTGTLAARTLAAGMMSGITSPTRTWFKLKIDEFGEDNEVDRWLAECQKRMMAVFQASNFYQSMALQYFDLAVFSSSCIIIYEDYENVIHCCNPCLGEFFFEADAKDEIRTVAREFTMNYNSMRQQFGNGVSDEVKRSAPGPESSPGAGSRERVICHLIEKNEGFGVVSPRFPWRESYWDIGSPISEILSVKGFHDWPAMTPRWDVQGNDAYGTGAGMDALGDIKQLQQETKRKAQLIDKMASPPLVADIQLKNQPMSQLPGGITYAAGVGQRKMVEALYHIIPPVGEMMQDIREIQQRIKLTFHNDLFSGITDLQTVRTATEIDARREEKLILLGPVLERILSELSKGVDRVWGIMWRGGLFPQPPQQLHGAPTHIKVDYVSMLALAQLGLTTAAIEKLWAFAGNIASVKPTILDNLDEDETIVEYGDALGVSPKIIRDIKVVTANRAKRDQEEQMAKAAELGQAAATGAKTLSETEVGGGINALQLALGGQGG